MLDGAEEKNKAGKKKKIIKDGKDNLYFYSW